MAEDDGGPMYCLMSARSTNARSMAPVMFDVARMMTLGNLNKMHNFMIQPMYQSPKLLSNVKDKFLHYYCIFRASEKIKPVHFNNALTCLGSVQACCWYCMNGTVCSLVLIYTADLF